VAACVLGCGVCVRGIHATQHTHHNLIHMLL